MFKTITEQKVANALAFIAGGSTAALVTLIIITRTKKG